MIMALDPRILLNPVQIAGPMDMLKVRVRSRTFRRRTR